MVFRLFLFFLSSISNFILIYVVFIKRIIRISLEYITVNKPNILIIKKLWTLRHVICYFMVDRNYPVNNNFFCSRG